MSEKDIMNVFCFSEEEVQERESDEINDEEEAYKELHKDDDKYAEPNPLQQDIN